MEAQQEEAQPLLLLPPTAAITKQQQPAPAGYYGSTAAAAGGEEDAPSVAVILPTTAPPTADADDDHSGGVVSPLLLVAALLAGSSAAEEEARATRCHARKQLGPWAALVLAIAGAVVGGALGPWLEWPRPVLLVVLAPCVLLASLPLAPALGRAVAHRYVRSYAHAQRKTHTHTCRRVQVGQGNPPSTLTQSQKSSSPTTHTHVYDTTPSRVDTTVLATAGILSALLLGHAGAALCMLALALLAERVRAAGERHVAMALGRARAHYPHGPRRPPQVIYR